MMDVKNANYMLKIIRFEINEIIYFLIYILRLHYFNILNLYTFIFPKKLISDITKLIFLGQMNLECTRLYLKFFVYVNILKSNI